MRGTGMQQVSWFDLEFEDPYAPAFYQGQLFTGEAVGIDIRDNSVSSIVMYVNGWRHGSSKHFHRNGMLEAEMKWNDGRFHGPFTMWYDTGEKHKEGVFVNGKISSLTRWDRNGNVVEIWSDGKLTYGVRDPDRPFGSIFNF